MADNVQPNIVLDGDITPLKRKLLEAGESFKKFGADTESTLGRMTGPLSALHNKFIALGAILAGGRVFKEAVEEAAKFTEESIKLGNALGTSATEASTYISALEDIDVSQEEFVGAAKGMLKELKNNETGLQAMGLKTRDAAGNLRPLNALLVEGVEVVNGYKAGTDRAIAGQAMFGKGFQANGNLLKLNSATLQENAELQQKLGILVGSENVAAWHAYDQAGDQAHLTLKALSVTIGNAVMPILTKLAEWFVDIGPAAVVVFKGAVGGLASIFWGLRTSIDLVWNTVALGIERSTIQVLRFGDVAVKAVKLDFKGAKAAWETGGEMLQEVTDKRAASMLASAEEAQKKLWELFAEGTPSTAPSTKGKSAEGLLEKEKPKKTAEESQMGRLEAELSKRKEIFSQENALREFSKSQELAYWETVLRMTTLGSKDRLAVEKKVSDLTVDIRRKEAKQKWDIDEENARSAQERALLRVDAEQAAAEALLSAGMITETQSLAMEQEFEQRRFDIKKSALQEKLALYDADPEMNPVEAAKLKNQLLEIEQQYLLKKNQLQGKYLQIQKKDLEKSNQKWEDLGQSVSGLWDKGITAMMNGTLKWRNATKAIYTELVGWFANSVVGAMLKKWIGGKAAEYAISVGWMTKEQAVKLGFMDAEVAAKETTAVKGAVATAEGATAEVGSKGASAAAGAADAVADIPYVGPILAAAAFASTLAMVLGARSNISSASRGFDIPRGVNPLVQAHEEEMVLPSKQANVIRRLADSDQQTAAGGDMHLHINAIDGASVQKLFRDNGHVLAKELRRQARNFTPKNT